jgi:hypothetical protein
LAEPEVTAAVKVNSVPEAIDPPDAIGLAPEFMVKVVLVGRDAAKTGGAAQQRSTTVGTEMRDAPMSLLIFTPELQLVLPTLAHFQPLSIRSSRIYLDPAHA